MNLFAGLKQDNKVKEKVIFPEFFNIADLRFQALYQAECDLSWSDSHHRMDKNNLLMILIWWNILARAGQSLGST